MVALNITLRCDWCGRRFERPPGSSVGATNYCSRLHQEWAEIIAAGEYPATECPRCGHHDMRIAAPDWAICQTCGCQTDRPDLPPGALTPRDMTRNMSETRVRLAISDRRIRR